MMDTSKTPEWELTQRRLVPSGCQQGSDRIVIAGDPDGRYFAFCSTLAIYVYDLHTFALVKLIAGGFERNITALSWSTENPMFLATATVDGRVVWWDLEQEKSRAHVELSRVAKTIVWSPHEPHEIYIGMEEGSILKYNIKGRETKEAMSTLARAPMKLKNAALSHMVVHPTQKDVLALAYVGSTSIYISKPKLADAERDNATEKIMLELKFDQEEKAGAAKSRVSKKKVTPSSSGVVDLQWDTLSTIYLLVAYKDSSMCLWDIESQSVVHRFEKEGAGVNSIVWIASAPGNFGTVNARTGIMRIWNVSQKHSLEHIRIGDTGINKMIRLPRSDKVLCSFVDGAVGIYDLIKRRTSWASNPGHAETIFDVQYQPSNANTLATCSYDSTTRIWDTETMECRMTLSGQEGIIYAVAWSPEPNDYRLATASSLGTIVLWNVELGQIQVQVQPHSLPIFKLSWNEFGLASTSSDRNVVISDPGDDCKELKRLKLPCATLGCHWNPRKKHLLAIGCADNCVRVFNANSDNVQVLQPQKDRESSSPALGPTDRIFHVMWSPLVSTLLASGSDDCNIYLWKVVQVASDDFRQSKCTKVLEGHTSVVRALLWSAEIPNVLLSGSWDSTIRVWDVTAGVCIQVVSDHLSDVYGLACHPAQPFVFASSSRDTTLRVWTLGGRGVQLPLLRLVLYGGDEKYAALAQSSVYDSGSSVGSLANIPPEPLQEDPVLDCLHSVFATTLVAKRKDESQGHFLYALFSYFSGACGMKDLWTLLQAGIVASNELKANSHDQQNNGHSDPRHFSSPFPNSNTNRRSLNTFSRTTRAGNASEALDYDPLRRTMSSAKQKQILHQSEVIGLSQAEAKHLESTRDKFSTFSRGVAARPGHILPLGGQSNLRKEEALAMSAQWHLKCGDVERYCVIMTDLGRWDHALAMAPAVSIQFWHALMTKYTDRQQQQRPVVLLPYLIASNQIEKAVEYFADQDELQDAFLLAKIRADGHFDALESKLRRKKEKSGATTMSKKRQHQLARVSRRNARLLREVRSNMAALYSKKGDAVLAACCYLSLDDYAGAIQCLCQGNLVELAFAVTQAVQCRVGEHILSVLIKKCERYDEIELALEFAQHMNDPLEQGAYLLARYTSGSQDERTQLRQRVNLRPEASYVEQALEHVQRQEHLEAIKCHILGNQMFKAAEYVLECLKECLSSTEYGWDFHRMTCLGTLMENIDAAQLSDLVREEFLVYMAFIAMQRAIWRGYCVSIVAYLSSTIVSLVQQHSDDKTLDFVVPLDWILIQAAEYANDVNDLPHARKTLAKVLELAEISREIEIQSRSLMEDIIARERSIRSSSLTSSENLNMRRRPVKNLIIVAGYALPSTGARRNARVSLFTSRHITGPSVVLEDGETYLSLDEAIMWANVNPFSPLHTGKRLNPY